MTGTGPPLPPVLATLARSAAAPRGDSAMRLAEGAQRVAAFSAAGCAGLAMLGHPETDVLATALLALVAWCACCYWLGRAGWVISAGLATSLGVISLPWWPGLSEQPSLSVVALLAPVAAIVFSAIALPQSFASGLAGTALLSTLTLGYRAPAFMAVDPGTLLAGFGGLVMMVMGTHYAVQNEMRRLSSETNAQHALLERFRLAADGADAGLWHWDVERKSIQLSPRGEDFLGLPHADSHDEEVWFHRVHPADVERLRMELEDFSDGRITHLEARFRAFGAEDGAVRWVLLRGAAVRNDDGRSRRLGGSLSDVTASKHYEEELVRGAFHDALTGLPNRALFLDRIGHACARAHRRPDLIFGVLFLDIDGFKIVNDSLGHAVGDALLVEFAKRLETCLRPKDTLARLGGDEFTILVEDLETIDQAEQVALRIQGTLKVPFRITGYELVMSASIGIAPSSIGYSDPADLLRDADTAMYSAKAGGKARHCLFVQGMRDGVVARMNLERDLYGAIEREEFELHYQPILDLPTLDIRGFEALVRWRKPDGRLAEPMDFIPLAEETGQIIPITWWVFEQACRTVRKWRAELPGGEDIWINVNVSGRHLAQPGLTRRLVDLLGKFDLPPSAFRLEITETVLLSPGVERCLSSLREAGIELHLDDFGTGYSSLSYLHKYPITGLKIDRAFISALDGNKQPGIVYSIIQLARNLSMTVTAEGVETKAQLDCLRAYGCGKAQGYYFSAPRPQEVIETMMRTGGRLPIS